MEKRKEEMLGKGRDKRRGNGSNEGKNKEEINVGKKEEILGRNGRKRKRGN